MRENKKGITLIALIIVIILMLILVGVTVSVALNGGLFKKAREAKNRQQEEEIKEQVQVAMAMSIDEKLMEYGREYFNQNGSDISQESVQEGIEKFGLNLYRKFEYV